MNKYEYRTFRPEVIKGMVTEILNTYPDITGPLNQVISCLQGEAVNYPEHTNLRLSSEPEPYEDGNRIVLLGDRPATEEEKEAQAQKDAADKVRRDEWDRLNYEHLKAKFEKNL